MSKEQCTCDGINTGCTNFNCKSRTVIKTEKSLPPLSYEIIEGNFKHLQGQILTVLEATMEGKQLEASKSLIKGFVNDKLTYLFEIWGNYGLPVNQELPDYDKE